jgi:hypothetical protein
MSQSSSRTTDFDRALGDAKSKPETWPALFRKAAQDVYGQAYESAADVAGTPNEAARRTMGSLEKTIRTTIETQPYAAALIALGVGWLLGRMHRPL